MEYNRKTPTEDKSVGALEQPTFGGAGLIKIITKGYNTLYRCWAIRWFQAGFFDVSGGVGHG